MSLLFIDGFDDGLTSTKWSVLSGITVSGATGRNGTGAYMHDNSSTLRKSVLAADEHATMIFGAAIKLGSGAVASPIYFHSDSAATQHITLEFGSSGEITIKRGGVTLGGPTAAATLSTSAWHYVECKITLHDTTGVAVLRVDGNTLLNLTNVDTKNAGTKAVLEGVAFQTFQTSVNWYADDFYLCNGAGSVNNDFLGDCAVQTLYPNGNGTYSAWVGSDGNSVNNYQQVDETGAPSTVDYNESGTATNKDTYAFTDATGAATLKGIQQCTYGAKSDAGVQQFRQLRRVNGVDYNSSDLYPSTSYLPYLSIMETSPNTGVAWTQTELNASEFGIEAR